MMIALWHQMGGLTVAFDSHARFPHTSVAVLKVMQQRLLALINFLALEETIDNYCKSQSLLLQVQTVFRIKCIQIGVHREH